MLPLLGCGNRRPWVLGALLRGRDGGGAGWPSLRGGEARAGGVGTRDCLGLWPEAKARRPGCALVCRCAAPGREGPERAGWTPPPPGLLPTVPHTTQCSPLHIVGGRLHYKGGLGWTQRNGQNWTSLCGRNVPCTGSASFLATTKRGSSRVVSGGRVTAPSLPWFPPEASSPSATGWCARRRPGVRFEGRELASPPGRCLRGGTALTRARQEARSLAVSKARGPGKSPVTAGRRSAQHLCPKRPCLVPDSSPGPLVLRAALCS